jgi:hypothetical protein
MRHKMNAEFCAYHRQNISEEVLSVDPSGQPNNDDTWALPMKPNSDDTWLLPFDD